MMDAPLARSGSPCPVKLKERCIAAPMLENEWFRCLSAANSRNDETNGSTPSRIATRETKRSKSSKGSGRSRSVLTALKMAVFAPMLRASASTAIKVTPGDLRSCRRANRRSFITQYAKLEWDRPMPRAVRATDKRAARLPRESTLSLPAKADCAPTFDKVARRSNGRALALLPIPPPIRKSLGAFPVLRRVAKHPLFGLRAPFARRFLQCVARPCKPPRHKFQPLPAATPRRQKCRATTSSAAPGQALAQQFCPLIGELRSPSHDPRCLAPTVPI